MSATPRTDAARARCGFADMAKMERELADALAELAVVKAEQSTLLSMLDAHDAAEGVVNLREIKRQLDSARADPALDALDRMSQPDTFEAHGHTWTRHTPGDPCPVPGNAMVHVMLRRELKGSMRDEVRPAANYEWGDYGGETWEIVGWRYAEKPLPPEMTLGEWAETKLWPPVKVEHRETIIVPPAQMVILPTAAECGQYADKHLAPSADDPATSIPKPLENQRLEDGEPVGNRTRDTLIKS